MDAAGNRTASTVGGVTTSYAYDSDDELLSTSGGFTNSYAYNANGDQTSRTLGGVTTALSYDYDDQMTAIDGASFRYDAAGRRVGRTAGGTTTAYQYDGGSVLLEKQGTSTTATYTYGNSLLRKDGETPLFDGMGSERTVTNTAGAVQGTLTTSAFGGAVAISGSSTSSYQFGATSGYRNDGDAGLVKVGCRYYDPQTGRFTTRDTVLSQKAYFYCEGNPVNAVDPSGHFLVIIIAVILFFIAEAPIREPLPTPEPIRGGPGPIGSTYPTNKPFFPPEARTKGTILELKEADPGESGGQGGGFYGGAPGFGGGSGGSGGYGSGGYQGGGAGGLGGPGHEPDE